MTLKYRWMALDVGTRKIGIAISDPLKITCRPLITIQRMGLEDDLHKIEELAREFGVEKILVGVPVYLSGAASETEAWIRPFIQALRARAIAPVEEVDERLSSKQAEELMAEMGIRPSDRRKRRDEFAAALILKWYLEENIHD